LEVHLPVFKNGVTFVLSAIVLRCFARQGWINSVGFGLFVNCLVGGPFIVTGTVPESNGIVGILVEEFSKILEDDNRVQLVWVA